MSPSITGVVTISRLSYVGATPTAPTDIGNRLQSRTLLSSGTVNRTAVTTQISDAIALRASKTYIDTQDALFQLPSYYQTRDALNIPIASVGQPNGVAYLDAGTGKVPLAQMPPLGQGYLLGPYGPTAVFGVTAGGTWAKIADFNVGVQSVKFVPLVYATVIATSASMGRTVIEARISEGSAAHDSQTLIARGTGRDYYVNKQAIAVSPTGSPGEFATTYNTWVSLWVKDLTQSTVVASEGIVSASVWLLRTEL